MIDIYVLNGDLEQVGIVDSYTSLIWVNRYDKEGDCELYVEATAENLNLLKKGYYLSRLDDEMVCRIERIELDTDAQDGNFLIITAYDVKKFLSQRVIWSTMNVDGNVEDFIREMIYKTLVNPNLSARAVKNSSGVQNFFLGDKAGFTQVTQEQVSYKIVSDKVQEICKLYGWGYKIICDVGNFYFILYEGTDRSDSVVFADEFENLISTKYIEDSSNLANVALVAGEGEGSDRARNVSGYAEGLDRYEIYVDAKDISRTITWGELIELYPTKNEGGYGYIYTTTTGIITYRMDVLNVAIVDSNQLTELKANYPTGQVVMIDGNRYFQAYDVIVADLESSSPDSNESVILRDIVYEVYLLTRGYDKLAEYGTVISFEGSVDPDITFKYKRDYFLGDKVTVRNSYGIEKVARISEIMEVCDDNGYVVEPHFEYYETGDSSLNYLVTENGRRIVTENGERIIVED